MAEVTGMTPEKIDQEITNVKSYVDGGLSEKADKSQVTSDLSKKADKTQVTSDLSKKADKTQVTSDLSKKADITYVDTGLSKKVDTTKLSSDLSKKADTTYVDSELSKKADTTQVNSDLLNKADITQVNSALSKKADTTQVNTNLSKKADTTYVDSELSKKADTTQVNSDLLNKADITYVDSGLSKKANDNDSRLPLVRPGEYAAVIGDGEHAALAVTSSGEVDFRRATPETKSSIMGTHDAVQAVESSDEHYAFRVSDRDGNVALAIDKRGAVDFRRATPETVNLLKSLLGQTPVESDSSNATDKDVWVTDKDDSGLHATHVATGIRTLLSDTAQEATPVGNAIVWEQEGVQMYRKDPHEPAWRATDRTRIAFWGSSSIQGSHAHLKTMATSFGITDVMLGGVGSDRGRHILGRMGAAPFTLKDSVTIPETGSVEFDTTNGAPLNLTSHVWTPGTLGGIPGRISHRGVRYAFTRNTAGQATTIPAGTEFIPDSVAYRDAPAILQIGKNDLAGEGASGELILEQTETAYRWLRTLPEWVAVLGHHVNSNWAGDSDAAARVKLANDLCRERYGERFIDLQDYLSSSQVWEDTGFTPSSEDLERQAAGVMPLALARDTGGHMNDTTVKAYVNNLVVPHLNKIGWF